MKSPRRWCAVIALSTGLFAAHATATVSHTLPASGNELVGLSLTPAPPTCDAQPLSAVHPGVASICVRDLTVLAVRDQQPQGTDKSDFGRESVSWLTDGHVTRTAHNNLWWEIGAMGAGQHVTVWGSVDGHGLLQVTRWVETAHVGQTVRLAQISQGLVPENTYVWTTGIVYLPLSQEIHGDGDTHLQMSSPCGPGGITAETTPALRGFVDRPLQGVVPPVGSVQGTQDDPPAEVPITVFGATRFDYGHGWWEVHPVRAWHLATPAELSVAGSPCLSTPPALNPATGALYGTPSCGADLPGELFCQQRCFLSATNIGRPPVVSNRCGESWQRHGPVTTSQVNGAALLAGVNGNRTE